MKEFNRVLTANDITIIEKIVTKTVERVIDERVPAIVERVVQPIIDQSINHAFATHPRLARMEKRDAKMQRDINYIVDYLDRFELKTNKRLDRLAGHCGLA